MTEPSHRIHEEGNTAFCYNLKYSIWQNPVTEYMKKVTHDFVII